MTDNKNAASVLEEYLSSGRINGKVTYSNPVNMTPNQGTAKFKCMATYEGVCFVGHGPSKQASKVAAAENVLKYVNGLENQKHPSKNAPATGNQQRRDVQNEPVKAAPPVANKNIFAHDNWGQGEFYNPHAADEDNYEQWDAPYDPAQCANYYPDYETQVPVCVYVYGPDIGPMDTITNSEPFKRVYVMGVTSDPRHVNAYKSINWRVVPADSARETFCALVVDQMNRLQYSVRHIARASPGTLKILNNACSALCFCQFEWAPIGVNSN